MTPLVQSDLVISEFHELVSEDSLLVLRHSPCELTFKVPTVLAEENRLRDDVTVEMTFNEEPFDDFEITSEDGDLVLKSFIAEAQDSHEGRYKLRLQRRSKVFIHTLILKIGENHLRFFKPDGGSDLCVVSLGEAPVVMRPQSGLFEHFDVGRPISLEVEFESCAEFQLKWTRDDQEVCILSKGLTSLLIL